MSRQSEFIVIIKWLRRQCERLSRRHFDEETEKMPPVRVECGWQEDFSGDEARYYPSERRIVFSPGFIASCRKEKKRFWDFSRLERTLVHELVHAWVDWKGKSSNFAGGHNEWFLWKAHCLGVSLDPTCYRWTEVVRLHNEIKRGWNPAYMSFDDWIKLTKALENWESKGWEDLISTCQIIEALEKTTGPDTWTEIVTAISPWNSSISDYEILKKVETYMSLTTLQEITEPLEYRCIPIYEIVVELKRRRINAWSETVKKWREVIELLEDWSRDYVSIWQISEELRSMHANKRSEIAEVVSHCKPLRRFIAHIKERFDREIFSTQVFESKLMRDCYDDEERIHLYAELNHLCFQGPDRETYEFFRRLSTI